jgi:heme exporter protein A
VIVLEGVSRKFGAVRALSDINLEIADGTTVAVLGANGSGKSTLLKLVTGLLLPTTGIVTVGGETPRKAKARLGYLGHEPFLYRYLSAAENLHFYADLYRVDRRRAGELLEDVGLAHKGEALVRTFSRGETQRLGLARTLLHDPEYLLLDEPFSGLDEAGSDLLPKLLDRPGRTVVLSTHDRAKAAELADRRLYLAGGRLDPAPGRPG